MEYMLSGFTSNTRLAMLTELRAGFTVRKPNAFMAITGLTDSYSPTPLNIGRLYTRHMRGVIEAERDRRLYA